MSKINLENNRLILYRLFSPVQIHSYQQKGRFSINRFLNIMTLLPVKIFGDIWTREDYRADKYGNGNSMRVEHLDINDTHKKSIQTQACALGAAFYYKQSVVKANGFAPSGWQVPTSTHYKEMQAMLTKYNLNSGLSFRNVPDSPGHSPLGYEAPVTKDDGWINIDLYALASSVIFLNYNYGGNENRY
jgi:hypothetical protein